jgi:amino acid transporter
VRGTDVRAGKAGAQKAEPSSRKAKQPGSLLDGMRAKDNAVLFGIVGFFFLGIFFGLMAIMSARKAKRLYEPATFGMILGWIDVLITIGWIMAFVGFLNGSGHLN